MRVSSARGAALKAGAEIIADAARVIAGRFSTRIPVAIHSRLGPGSQEVFINAGTHGGKWGWSPIHAWMFEEPHAGPIPKHPLFGNRHYWYYQPYRPYMEEAAETAGQRAAEVYGIADTAILVKEHGYK